MLLYRLALSLAALPLFGLLQLRRLRGGETWADLNQRRGKGDSAWDTPPLWVHGASNGELTSARPLIESLLSAYPDLHLLITANTLSGRALVQGWGHSRIVARLAPLDLRRCLRRFLAAQAPIGLLMIENEIWPNRLAMLKARRHPVAVVGARLSERSARGWRRFGPMMRRLARAYWLVSPQSQADADRFAAFQLSPGVLTPPVMLKAAVRLPEADPDALAAFRSRFDRGATLLAASTHPGEEEPVIAAFSQARKRRPGLRLILAPRHPARGDEVSALLAAARLPHARRSRGALPGPLDAVYLADTLGEMGLWYRLAGTCFVGGSLVDKGGHTPYEPALAGCAVLHGPHTANFAEAYARLAAAEAALAVPDAETLGLVLGRLSPKRSEALGQAARETLDSAAALAGIADLTRRLGQIFALEAKTPHPKG